MDTSKIYFPFVFLHGSVLSCFHRPPAEACTVSLRLLLVRIYVLSVAFTVPVSIPQISLKI